MKLRDVIGLVIAIILAVGVAFLTRVFLTQKETPHEKTLEEGQNLNKILVAKKILKEGDRINIGDIAWQNWPQSALHPNYIKEGSLKIEDLTGAIVRFPLHEGEPIVLKDLIQPGERGILAAVIAPGKRAISIDVTPQSANSGLIFPGDHVDVILSKIVSTSSGTQMGESKTIVSNVRVLAMDIEMGSTQENPKSIPKVATLEVSHAQAEKITAGAKEGSLSLSLHSIGKEALQDEDSEGESEMLSKPMSIIIMRGKEKSEIQVQEQ